MKKFYFILLTVFFVTGVNAQVDVTATGGTTSASYTTLKDACDAINAGTHTGTITIGISGNTTEVAQAGAASVILNASGSGSASYTGISVSPTGGVARTITGAATAGSALLELNGADNVTINGLNAGGNSLTIVNTATSASAGTSTIKFISGAINNTVTNCNIQGSSTMSANITGGTIFFSNDLVTPNGNDNNTISYNNIGPVGTNLSSKAIYSVGSAISPANHNSGNIISGNNIFDYFSPSMSSAGIYLGNANTGWTISDNKLYQTAARIQTIGTVHAGIQLASSTISNCLISGNTIGFSNSSGTGTYSFDGIAASKFYPIYAQVIGTATASSIQNNTITAISVTGPVAGSGSTGPFIGICCLSGLANIGTVTSNTIGSTTSPGAIVINSSSSSLSEISGILYIVSGQPANIANNKIGGINVNNSSTGGVSFYGIRTSTSASVINTIQNNTIGYAAAPVSSNAASNTSRMGGIFSQNGSPNIIGNTVAYMENASSGTGTDINSVLVGIYSNGFLASSMANISLNTVHSITNTEPAAAVSVIGIMYIGNPSVSGSTVSGNNIHSLELLSNNAAATLTGMYTYNGTTTFANNMISLGLASNGTSITNGIQVFGISEPNLGDHVFSFNSVHINGTGVTGSSNTYALQSLMTNNSHYFENNIFYNARSNGTGSGKHYAISLAGTGVNPMGLLSDHNDLLAAGTGGVSGLYDGADRVTLADWQLATGQDANSKSVAPVFITATDLHLEINPPGTNCQLDGYGQASSVLTDYDVDTRDAATPDMGADEFTSIPSPTLAAIAGGGQVCSNTTVGSSGTVYKDAVCNVIAKVVPSGASPVAGTVNSCVTIDASVQNYNSAPYLQRHFNIEPATNAATSTATITLYVLQSEFNAYNAANGGFPDLPISGNNADPNIANLRITQYHGTGTAPGNYTGASELIDPADVNIVWDAVNNWWEITFGVTGFSGLYIHTTLGGVLPANLLTFAGQKEGTINHLRWTTASEQNNQGFEVQRSIDGINYFVIGFVNSLAVNGNSSAELNYDFIDNNPAGAKQYYRLRQVNISWHSKLSNTVLIKTGKPVTLAIGGLFPNPAIDQVNVIADAPVRDKMTLTILDATGRVMVQQMINVEAGSNTIPVDISRLAPGTYLVKLACTGCETVVSKFVKQ